MDQPHAPGDVLHLAALDVADEVPREQVTVRVLLRQQRIGAVLADQRHAGLVQRRQVVSLDVLGRGQDLDAVAHLGAHAGQVLGDQRRVKQRHPPPPGAR